MERTVPEESRRWGAVADTAALGPGLPVSAAGMCVESFVGGPWALPWSLAACGVARRAIRDVLPRWGLGDLVATAELLVSELVGNALLHGAGPLCLTLEWVSDMRCLVGDGSSQPPRLTEAGLEDEGGRGLALVDMLATRWGHERAPVGKNVWFELSTGAESSGLQQMNPSGMGHEGLEGLEIHGVEALEGDRQSEAA